MFSDVSLAGTSLCSNPIRGQGKDANGEEKQGIVRCLLFCLQFHKGKCWSTKAGRHEITVNEEKSIPKPFYLSQKGSNLISEWMHIFVNK